MNPLIEQHRAWHTRHHCQICFERGGDRRTAVNLMHWRNRTWVLLILSFTAVMAFWHIAGREEWFLRSGCGSQCQCWSQSFSDFERKCKLYIVAHLLLPLVLWLLGTVVLTVTWILTRRVRNRASG
jgi:hypothetical protein